MSLITEFLARRAGGMAALYEQCAAPLERAGATAVRARLAADLRGRVIEIGCGTGLNFAHYAAGTEVTAIELLDEFRVFAGKRAHAVAAHVEVVEGDAEALPFPDESFDAALCTLVFCSVPDPLRGLQELRRVVKPGAPVRLLEHVRSEHPVGAALQYLCNPLWSWVMDGCNLTRDTVSTIRAAGFTIDRLERPVLHVPRAPTLPMCEVYARA